MKMKTFRKSVFRDLKKNLSRFIAIIAIMALGVGFLIGLLSATPDLEKSMDSYYDREQMWDILIKNTDPRGFTEEDLENLQNEFSDFEKAETYFQNDIVGSYQDSDITLRQVICSFSSETAKIHLIEGTFPQEENEIVVQNIGIFQSASPVGKSLKIRGNDYTIVGVCESPVYFYKLPEPALAGTGNLDAVVYQDRSFSMIPYPDTDLVIRVAGFSSKNCFSSKYFDDLKVYEEQLENLAKENHKSWIVLDRKSNASYVSFKENAEKVNKIAVVFPVFFFFIAALIALTSMTRLVTEDRMSIGTLKSLGFSKGTILAKYLSYSFLACIIGSVGGILIGVYLLPMVIYQAYVTLFLMPKGIFLWNGWFILLAFVSMTGTILAVTIYTCLKTLKERPNSLLIPRSPRPGKRILLEKIPWIWSHLKFKYKSAIRNIFRFKKNLLMMMIGIGGCMALILVAFGLQDSINALSQDQYRDILKYDLLMETSGSLNLEEIIKDSQTLPIRLEKTQLKENTDYDVSLIYADERILEYMDLNVSEFRQKDVIISKQLSVDFHWGKNDLIRLQNSQSDWSFTISSVFENYIGNYVIVYSEDLSDSNALFLRYGTDDRKREEEIVQKLYQLPEIRQIEVLSTTKENYGTMLDSLRTIISVIILCSGALAVIVIYNLTNININERLKEIATLKVLGYHRKEICGYIYREIIIMSVFGMLFGFLLGVVLNYFVMHQLASIGQYFKTSLNGWNYLYGIGITLAFVLLVLVLFIPKMKKIKMVESLKCVD